MYPVNLVLEGKRCVVIGGGEVAARKARGLLDAGAVVTVICPEACGEVEALAQSGKLNLVRREYTFGDLDGMAVALVATDDSELNELVAEDAREEKVPVNVADDPSKCDFTLPAVLRRKDVTVAVGTGGASPLLSAKLRDMIENVVGSEYGDLARILGELRKRFAEREMSPQERRETLESLMNPRLVECLKCGDYEAAMKIIKDLTGEEEISLENNR